MSDLNNRNVYGSNKPASEDTEEPNIRDSHSPEQIDALVQAKQKLEQEKLGEQSAETPEEE